jgi:hypothetical protein
MDRRDGENRCDRIRADVAYWHKCEATTASEIVRLSGQTGVRRETGKE